MTSAGRNRSSWSEGYSDTSGALRSNDDLGSLGYSFEHSDLEAQPELLHSEPTPGCNNFTLSPHNQISTLIAQDYRRWPH